jgi:hypothetical protein
MTPKEEPRRLRRQAGEGNGSGGGAAISVGARLKAAREARGVDLFRVERDTKIRVKFLTALEEEQFSELPADVYARGFLRNYATYLGLDPDGAWEEWRHEAATPRPSTSNVLPSLAGQMTAPAVPQSADLALRASREGSAGAGSNGSATPGSEAAGARTVVVKLPEIKLPQVKLPLPARTSKVPPAEQMQGRTPKPEPSILQSPAGSPRVLKIPDFLPWHRPAPAESPIGGPQPIQMPRRAIAFGPAHVVLLLLLAFIVAVGGYFALQWTKVVEDPLLTVVTPADHSSTVPAGTTTFDFSGESAPRAQINISWDSMSPTHVQADARGNWTAKVTLHKDSNWYDIWAMDTATLREGPKTSYNIRVLEPSATPVPEVLTVDAPSAGQTFSNGVVNVYGTTVALTSVTVTATYLGVPPPPAPSGGPSAPVRTSAPTAIPTIMPVPTATPLANPTATPRPTPTPNPSVQPAPQTIIPFVDGRFSTTLHLYSGLWRITVVGTNKDGVNTPPDERTIIVTAGSLVVQIDVKGSPGADMKVWKDGKLLAGYSPFKHFGPGQSTTIVANQSVWIWTRIPRNTYVTINGASYGHLGPGNAGASWRMTAFSPPTLSNDR